MYNSKIENRLMEQKLNEELEADNQQVIQPNANTNVSGSRHKWDKIISDDGNYCVCKHCGIEKWDVIMGYGKNGHAAIYILKDGERTSYRPDCK